MRGKTKYLCHIDDANFFFEDMWRDAKVFFEKNEKEAELYFKELLKENNDKQ